MKIKHLMVAAISFCPILFTNGQNNPKVVFRYDDFALTPSQISDSITTIFIKNEIPLCLGVIPFDKTNSLIFNLSQKQLDDLRSNIHAGKIEIALHGYNHMDQLGIPFFERKSFSEFAGAKSEIQLTGIRKGKRSLDSLLLINTEVFVPPFNTYDKNTLKILENLNFKIISGNMAGPSLPDRLKYIPSTCEDFSVLTGIISRYMDKNVTIVVYFHGYSFREASDQYPGRKPGSMTFRQLDALLHRIKLQNLSFYSFSDLARTADYDYSLYRENTFKYNLIKKVLNKAKYFNYGIYSSRELNKKDVILSLGNILLHFLCFILVYFFVTRFFRIFHIKLKTVLILYGIVTLPVLTFLYYIRNDFSFWIILLISAVVLTAAAAAIFSAYRPKPELADRVGR
jgi:hypothetical protein